MTRTLAISDIHGCLVAFETLLQAVQPEAEDLIVMLGDYMDRGPNSSGVLDRLIQLRKDSRVVCLRGNHDVVMIESRRDDQMSGFWVSMGGRATINSYPGASIENVPDEHWRFLENDCVDWYETDSHIFVHGYVEPGVPMAQQSEEIMFWMKTHPSIAPHGLEKIVVCGHTIQNNGLPLDLGHTICLDTGAFLPDGWLTCLDVNIRRFWQANERGQSRTMMLDQITPD